jgi:hypothetical protein
LFDINQKGSVEYDLQSSIRSKKFAVRILSNWMLV